MKKIILHSADILFDVFEINTKLPNPNTCESNLFYVPYLPNLRDYILEQEEDTPPQNQTTYRIEYRKVKIHLFGKTFFAWEKS